MAQYIEKIYCAYFFLFACSLLTLICRKRKFLLDWTSAMAIPIALVQSSKNFRFLHIKVSKLRMTKKQTRYIFQYRT